MAESGENRFALVTGANKGIGFEICKQLASNGIRVVLTARDVKRGTDAVAKFKETRLSDLVTFHQLDVVDPASVASSAQFVKSQLGKLDILVNNSGIDGVITDEEAIKAAKASGKEDQIEWSKVLTATYERAIQCIQTNYYGTKRMIEHFIPILESSDSPTIVNVSSSLGWLKNFKNEWAKGILSDIENLTEEKIDSVVDEFLKDFNDGLLEAKGWPTFFVSICPLKSSLECLLKTFGQEIPKFFY